MAERSDKPVPSELSRLLDPKRVRFEIETLEDPKEKDERLRKEFLSFLFILLVPFFFCSGEPCRRIQ